MNGDKLWNNPTKFIRLLGICFAAILLVFEVIICVQYAYKTPAYKVWKLLSLIGCSLALDILFFIELYYVKTMKARIVVYCIDFVFLLLICALSGSTYIAGLYCIVLSQLYLNVEDWRNKTVVFVASGLLYTVTCVLGWFMNYRRAVTYTEIIDIAAACFVGLMILFLHFAVANFLISFYRNNLKLTQALKEADASKAELKEAYTQLSETAVFQERNRIARDIHDNAGHSMTAVIMQTEAAKLLIDTNPTEAKSKIIAANIQAKNALEQMRESVHLLAGRGVTGSVKDELESICAQTMDGTDVKVRNDICETSLSWEKRRFICSSLKECFANGIRHGGATAFYVELAREGGMVRLTVSDNGCGLPDDFKEGYGIRGMREKAKSFGGMAVFRSESGDGCEVEITITEEDGEEE